MVPRMNPIYLDHNATTPVAPEVFEAMKPYFVEHFGNAMSKQHSFGWQAQLAVDKAREQVASLIGAQAREIIFTSGATESVHLAVIGMIRAIREQDPNEKIHLITEPAEHKCVLDAYELAKEFGCEITFLPINKHGRVDPRDVEKAITPHTKLVTLLHANNEIGSLQAVHEIGKITRAKNVLFHVDAAQTLGKHPINVVEMNIDLLSVSAHKLYGPKGAGALYVRQSTPRVRLKPFLGGGNQERGLRGGTQNVPAIVGLGAACELAAKEMKTEFSRQSELRDYMIKTLLEKIPNSRLNGAPNERLINNVSISVPGVKMDQLLLKMKDIAFSSGSACSAGTKFSHVLKAIGLPEDEDYATLRFGLGRSTTKNDIDTAIARLLEAIPKIG
jgi:cysteine desulfurase